MTRSRARGAAAAALFLAAVVAAEYFASSAALDAHFSRRAALDLQRLARGVSPFRWDFDDESEIRRGRSRGLDSLSFRDGVLAAVAADADPFFTLEQEERLADPRLHTRLTARIRVSRKAALQIHHTVRGDARAIESPLVPLRPGWQEVRVDLPDLEWRALRFDGATGAPLSREPARWGGVRGEDGIESLRLDPACEAGVEFAIDWVRLDGPLGMRVPDLGAPIVRRPLRHAGNEPDSGFVVRPLSLGAARSEVALAALRARAADPPVVELRGIAATPERLLSAIDAIRGAAPAAIVFPRRVAAKDLEPVAGERLLAPMRFGSGEERFRRRLLAGSAIAAAALVPLWIAVRRRAAPRSRAAADLAFFVATAFVLLYASRDFGESLAPGALVAAILALGLAAAVGDGGASVPVALGLALGSGRAWRHAAVATIAPFVLVAAVGWAASDGSSLAIRTRSAAAYAGFALVQQFLLGPVVSRRLFVLSGGREGRAALGAALLFSLLHFPNFALMAATLFMGAVWAALFLRFGTILPGAASHAALGTAFALLAPEGLRRSGVVGFRYFT